jgi:hypothetical protein
VSEFPTNIGAASIELGFPLAVAVLFWRAPKLRSKLVVLLGALTPPLIVYLSIGIGYLLNSADRGARWAFDAAWEMSVFPYIAIIGAGLALSCLSRPRRNAAPICIRSNWRTNRFFSSYARVQGDLNRLTIGSSDRGAAASVSQGGSR